MWVRGARSVPAPQDPGCAEAAPKRRGRPGRGRSEWGEARRSAGARTNGRAKTAWCAAERLSQQVEGDCPFARPISASLTVPGRPLSTSSSRDLPRGWTQAPIQLWRCQPKPQNSLPDPGGMVRQVIRQSTRRGAKFFDPGAVRRSGVGYASRSHRRGMAKARGRSGHPLCIASGVRRPPALRWVTAEGRNRGAFGGGRTPNPGRTSGRAFIALSDRSLAGCRLFRQPARAR